MRTEEDVKKAMESVKTQLTRSTGEGTSYLQGQYSAFEWVISLDEDSGGGEQ